MALRALLVGINAYQRQPLKGCLNDVSDVRDLLVERCGFQPLDIRLLLDGEATARNIREALDTWLVKEAVPGDKLVFHYSGHGSRLPGRGDEVDDIICPADFDFDTLAKVSALTDDDFREIFARLPDRVDMVWISDSCHSGELAIDERKLTLGGAEPRYLEPPPDVTAEIERRLSRRGLSRSIARSIEHFRGVMLAGCDASESSYDARFNGRNNGAFTYHLLKQLRDSDGLRLPVTALHDVTAGAVSLTFRRQHPQLRGSREQKQRTFLALNPPLLFPAGAIRPVPSSGGQTPSVGSASKALEALRLRPRASKRVALVIGNARYDMGSLPNPARDAELMTRTLSAVGFEIFGGGARRRAGTLLGGVDLDKDRMVDLTAQFCATLSEGATAVIYYAGHGIQVGDVNFLVPTDAKLDSPAPSRELISLNMLIENASSRVGRAGHVIVFLDACRDNPFTDQKIHDVALDLSRRVTRSRSLAGTPHDATARRGLAPVQVSRSAPARQFIAYATAPGDTAVDGPRDQNSPFAAALARHICVRGMDLNDCFDRVGRDVLAQVERMEKVQDPWKSANLKEPYYFAPRSWWPMLELALLAVPCGLLAAYFAVNIRGPRDIAIHNPWEWQLAWLGALSFAPVLAMGTMRWGSGRWRDLLFAILGSALAFALAMIVLQLVQFTEVRNPATQAFPQTTNTRPYTQTFGLLALGAGALTFIGTVMCWEKGRALKQKVLDLLFPVVLTVLLLLLVKRLFDNNTGVSAAFVFTSLVAGMLFAGGTSLACKPQGSVFRGYGAASGAMVVGLALPTFSYLHFEWWWLPVGLRTYGFGAIWFAMLGAQLGYCYVFYVPEYQPQTFDKRKSPRRDDKNPSGAAPPKPLTPEQESAQLDVALADREADEVLATDDGMARVRGEPKTPADTQQLAARVSADALALIVRHETGGRPHYENVYKSRPVWPGEASGVTIGFGYDLGFQDSPESVARDWRDVLPDHVLARLRPGVGLRATDPGRPAKVSQLKGMVRDLVEDGITIPWPAAQNVFSRVTLPLFAGITASALPGHEKLADDCFGALVSLTFNRGPSFDRKHDPEKDPLDRYREMRQIKAAVASGDCSAVPALIRAMKRIWKGKPVEGEMSRRRENEARLFEEGLARMAGIVQVAYRIAQLDLTPRTGESFVPDGVDESEIDAEAEEAEELDARTRGIELPGDMTRAPSRVGWASDDNSPDYAHLEIACGAAAKFGLRAVDLELLAELNSFPVEEAGSLPVLFGLRGCGIVDDHGSEMSDEVMLRDQRPDHDTTRCVLGVWDRKQGKIAVFEGSTVPDKLYVAKWRETGRAGNMLATGLYGYVVGVHNGRPGCFLLRSSLDKKRTVLVRRTKNNLVYELTDIVNKTAPGDNIHPTFSRGPSDFGSAGCQVVRGNADARGNHTGQWADFRRHAGLRTPNGKEGTPYLYMLLTGAELMLAARARTNRATSIPEVRKSLTRLRFGSKGPAVARLQRYLEIDQSGLFDAATAMKLYELQQRRSANASDGIFSPRLDEALAAAVFSEAPPPSAPLLSEGSPPETQASQPPSPLPPTGEIVLSSASHEQVAAAVPNDDDLPEMGDEDVLRGIPPEPDEGIEMEPRDTPLRAPTSIVRLKIEQKGSEYFALDADGERCLVGKAMSYPLQNSRGLGLYQRSKRYDRFEEEKRSGLWAHFIWPSAMAESQGRQIVLNTWDRAHLTWGFYQLAAHTADENLIVLFRELLKLPLARLYFPDLTLHENRVALVSEKGPRSLEGVVVNPRNRERQIPDFMVYMNPSITSIDDAEVMNCAKLVHWAARDPEMLITTTRVSIDTMKRKLARLDKMFALTGRCPEVALWVSDIVHQGRARKETVARALALPDSARQLEALSRIDGGGKYASRCTTVRKHLAILMDEKRFEGIVFGQGPLSLRFDPPSPLSPPPSVDDKPMA